MKVMKDVGIIIDKLIELKADNEADPKCNHYLLNAGIDQAITAILEAPAECGKVVKENGIGR